MRLGHRGIIGLGIVAVAAGAFNLSGATPAKAGPSIGFSTPNVMDPMESVGEPTIVHSPARDNTVYASGPWGTGTQRSIWNASADLGETFRLVNQCPPANIFVTSAPCPPPTAVSGTANPPGGGDTDQRLDSHGKDYFADLWALACDRVATTTNHGKTAPQFFFGCNSGAGAGSGRPEGSDRQWLSVFDPGLTHVTSTAPDKALAPLTYMEYNNLQTIQSGCSYWVKSTDGLHYTPANNNNGNFGCDGYPSVDQVTGKVFEASGCTVASTPSLCLNIGTPITPGQVNGTPTDPTNGDLCFRDDSAATTIGDATISCPDGGGLITVASGLTGDPDLLFTVSSMDTGRNLHITFAINGSVNSVAHTSTYQVFTTVAPANNAVAINGCTTNCWNHWATPVQVSLSPANVNVFPWVVAGGPGRSDSVWYGTNSFIDPSTNGNQVWNVWMNQAVWPVNNTGAVTLAPPSLTMVRVSPHPAHYDSICLQGTGCITSKGDRNLADFFTVTLDHSGAAEVEYDDTSNGLIQSAFTPGSGLLDHPGAPVVTIARQDSGPGLFGSDVSLRPSEPSAAPTIGQTDPSGDALYPVIGGTNQPAFDFVNGKTSHLANQLSLSADGKTLTVKMNVADLTNTSIANAFSSIPGSKLFQYVTRWVLCGTYSGGAGGNCKIYYAEAEAQVIQAQGPPQYQFLYYGGAAQSIDLCSVSACDPHVEVYPDISGNMETGSVSCPTTPSATNPCTLTVNVKTSDIGNPTSASLLEEVGSYAFAADEGQSIITNGDAEADLLPLEIDGTCCFNFMNNLVSTNVPESPWAPGLLIGGALIVAVGAVQRQRNRRRIARTAQQ